MKMITHALGTKLRRVGRPQGSMATARVATTIHENAPQAGYSSGDPRGRHASRRKYWRENALESSDENIGKKFDWQLIRKFGPYLARYKGWVFASIGLLLLYILFSLANPFLIAVAIDKFISHGDLKGLAIISVVLVVVNVLMWQAQYWQVWTMSWAGQQILYHLSTDMFTRLQQLS